MTDRMDLDEPHGSTGVGRICAPMTAPAVLRGSHIVKKTKACHEG